VQVHVFALLASLMVSAHAAEPLELPVRVHLISSDVPELDSSATSMMALRDRFREINQVFAAAGIVWEIESVVVDRPGAESAYRQAMGDQTVRRRALNGVRSSPTRLAPDGFDVYVVQKLGPVGIGGAYQCAANEPPGAGAAFVGAVGKNKQMLPTRKWAHELGHMLGLGHTPCTSDSRQRLMMSGSCELSKPGRVGFTDAEIGRMRAQARVGHAAPCKKQR